MQATIVSRPIPNLIEKREASEETLPLYRSVLLDHRSYRLERKRELWLMAVRDMDIAELRELQRNWIAIQLYLRRQLLLSDVCFRL